MVSIPFSIESYDFAKIRDDIPLVYAVRDQQVAQLLISNINEFMSSGQKFLYSKEILERATSSLAEIRTIKECSEEVKQLSEQIQSLTELAKRQDSIELIEDCIC